MAYDQGLADRIRLVLAQRDGAVTEKAMFGGLAFLVEGRMFVGVVKRDLMVRTGPAAQDAALRRPHVRPMDFTGRPLTGYVYVAPEGLDRDEDLARWVNGALAFVHTLADPDGAPLSKQPSRTRRKR